MRGVWCPRESNHRAANDPTPSPGGLQLSLVGFGTLWGPLVYSKTLKTAQNTHFSTLCAKYLGPLEPFHLPRPKTVQKTVTFKRVTLVWKQSLWYYRRLRVPASPSTYPSRWYVFPVNIHTRLTNARGCHGPKNPLPKNDHFHYKNSHKKSHSVNDAISQFFIHDDICKCKISVCILCCDYFQKWILNSASAQDLLHFARNFAHYRAP